MKDAHLSPADVGAWGLVPPDVAWQLKLPPPPVERPQATTKARNQRLIRFARTLSPGRSFVILAVALFVSEYVVMFLMDRLPAISPWLHNALDAVLMLALAFPALYALVLRPLHRHLRERQGAEAALQEANRNLAQRAAEQRILEKQVLDIMETERQRVGRDLHDSLGGKLTGAALMGKALAQRLAGQSSVDAGLAEEIVKCVNQCIAQTRGIARGLCPVEWGMAGLVSALSELAAETQRHSEVVCRFEAEGELQVADSIETSHLFRIAQEAVANAIRHGRPRQLTISLGVRHRQLCLDVANDGAGLPANALASAGLGLRTMNYRAALIGATLTVKNGAAGGAVVTCLVPLAAAGET